MKSLIGRTMELLAWKTFLSKHRSRLNSLTAHASHVLQSSVLGYGPGARFELL